MTGFQLKWIFPCMKFCRMLIEFSEEDGAQSARGIHFLDMSISSLDKVDQAVAKPSKVEGPKQAGQPQPVTVETLPYSNLATHISHIVGICNNSRLVFLDTGSWICSVDLEDRTLGSSYLRHFYVPYDWFSGSKEVICTVTKERNGYARDREVLLARNDELAIIRGGFEYVEEVPVKSLTTNDIGTWS